ncbi:hypothetical protein FOQG_02002 [Fusarium oxysporum f. sp. raphani 54005]|uniref:Uncharacterized protein n=2 Tax=Fusarium oxysporum f. sp. raphani TaxID=96318 RepID=X0CY78_FUSOX|nr:hypothetical protein FOQG_02002 [Fusarium oxysporum f. sp. raphani 54005]KAG7430294.1 hypothetical protein Forpi1262_v009316 [Fusarium oxysporum f. sp. raphani]KAG7431109.1 hypothetical protein Forpi1262_v008246 [Fusarium oxysporum f. sp. raphani]
MAAYQKLQRDPASKDLFNKRITTLEGLRNISSNSSFLAIDTEHIAVTSERDRVLHQLGIAFLPTLKQSELSSTDATSTSTNRPSLKPFYDDNEISGLTLNINIRKEVQDHLIALRGGKGLPIRRSLRFGEEKRVDIENLESAVIEFIQNCNHDSSLVLLGFGMAAEWTYLFEAFPRAIPLFSAWVDLRDIAKDITSSTSVIPGLVPCLQLFGYHWKDILSIKGNSSGGIADNAGDDAVSTCALANALLSPTNQEKLIFRQQCAQIAQVFSKKNGHQILRRREAFAVAVTAHQQKLPASIDSGMKLARQFFDYSPKAAGILSPDVACVTFSCEEHMDRFMSEVDGLELPTGERLLVERQYQQETNSEKENKLQDEKRVLRERQRQENNQDNLEDLGDLFF